MPVPVRTDDQLGWAFLTGAINEVRSTANFFKQLAFPVSETLPTETIELSYMQGDRKLAPFVQVNGEAISVPGRSNKFVNVTAPNIRIKRPMEAYENMRRRMPGSAIFVDGGTVGSALSQRIAEDVEVMASMIDNRIEQMCCEIAVNARFQYDSTTDNAEGAAPVQDAFDIQFSRNAALTGTALTGANAWWDVSLGAVGGTAESPLVTFDDAKFQLSKFDRSPAVAVLGRAAAQGLVGWAADNPGSLTNTSSGVDTGRITRRQQYTDAGALFLGEVMGVECWEYSRTYIDVAGAEQYFFPQYNIAFLTPESQRDNRVYYGAIPDHDAIDGGLMVAERFSKSWVQPDPSVRVQLAHSRPLPALRRPDAIYTRVVSVA